MEVELGSPWVHPSPRRQEHITNEGCDAGISVSEGRACSLINNYPTGAISCCKNKPVSSSRSCLHQLPSLYNPVWGFNMQTHWEGSDLGIDLKAGGDREVMSSQQSRGELCCMNVQGNVVDLWASSCLFACLHLQGQITVHRFSPKTTNSNSFSTLNTKECSHPIKPCVRECAGMFLCAFDTHSTGGLMSSAFVSKKWSTSSLWEMWGGSLTRAWRQKETSTMRSNRNRVVQ